MKAICERLGAEPVQEIGKMLVIYRENPERRPKEGRFRGRVARMRCPRQHKFAAEQAREIGQAGARTPLDNVAQSTTSTISNSFTPPGVRTSATSPEDFPMSALAIGEE